MPKLSVSVALLVILILRLLPVQAQDSGEVVTHLSTPPDPSSMRLEEIVTGLDNPIYLTSAGDGSERLFVLEQTGTIELIKDGALQSMPFLDITNRVNQEIRSSYSERGLLGLAFHPNYSENGQFFVHYSDLAGDTVIARYHVSADNPDAADPGSEEIIFTHEQPFPNHNGGQIDFGPDGYLYIGLGDGGSGGDPLNNGQTPDSLLGKILRIDVDGEVPYSIPPDNPANGVNPDLAPEIWAWGLRNPYRFSFDRATGDLYIADVGQNQWEEVNFEAADSTGGENYGWNVFEATKRFSNGPEPANAVMPIAEYDHSNGCSITGGYVYRGEAIPALQGVYIFGDWCSGKLWATYRDDSDAWQTMPFGESFRQITAFGQGDDGELYLVAYNGGIWKFMPTS
jgi:glucose/arabinose dehydrogenase